MDNIDISKLDLNLLRTFVILMEERNVSRASERLNISQSATSNALERIRESFNDRILEREGRVMQPTRAALELWPQISQALSEIESVLNAYNTFDPATVREHFTIGIDEYSMLLNGRQVINSIRSVAPKVTLSLVSANPENYTDQLARNQVDLLIAPVWQSLPDLVIQPVYKETFVGLMSSDHPLAGKRMTLKRYINYPHLLVSTRGIVTGNVDVGLDHKNQHRKVVLSTPWLETAVGLLSGSEMLLNIGKRLSQRMLLRHPVDQFELPIEVPGFEVCLLWHPRTTSDSHHRWLRRHVRASLENVDFVSS